MFSNLSRLKKLPVLLVMIVVLVLSSANNRSLAQGAPAVTEYSIPTNQSRPFGITAGPDGAMWVAEGDGNKIGRVAIDGKITEFGIPTAGSKPSFLVSDPDAEI